MSEHTTANLNRDVIKLAFNSQTLALLIRSGQLHVSDFYCLDKDSKQGVWSLLRSGAASQNYNQA